MIRKVCGTVAGALAHQTAGEKQCGWCAAAEQNAHLAAERIRPLPFAEGFYHPVTEEQASANRAVLAAEIRAHERDHGQYTHGLRVVRDGAA